MASTQVGVFLTRYNMAFYQKLIMLVVVLSFATLWIYMFIKAYYGSDEE